MSHSGLEVVLAVNLVEPNCEFGVSNSGGAKSVKLSDFSPVGEEMSSGMCGYCSSKAMAGDTSLACTYMTFYNPNFCLYWATVSSTCFLISLKA